MSRLLYACSSNPGKLHEFGLAAAQCGQDYWISTLPGLANIAVPEETEATLKGNASSKAIYYSSFTQELVFADDSGLEVKALGGAPGVHSARYAGQAATGAANNGLLLRNLNGMADRTACFVCVIALARSGQLVQTFSGSVPGILLESPRGENGFGYDPLFFHSPSGRSFGELSDEEKLAVSHRGQAFRALLAWLAKPLALS